MTNQANQPSLIAYCVRESDHSGEPKSYWTRVGVAWEHRDEEGFNLELNAVPVSGKIVLRPAKFAANDEDMAA
jgi:hypothetical protein